MPSIAKRDTFRASTRIAGYTLFEVVRVTAATCKYGTVVLGCSCSEAPIHSLAFLVLAAFHPPIPQHRYPVMLLETENHREGVIQAVYRIRIPAILALQEVEEAGKSSARVQMS